MIKSKYFPLIDIALAIGGIVFVVKLLENGVNTLQNNIVSSLTDSDLRDAQSGLAYSKDKLTQSIYAALKRGETIPPDILKRAGITQ